MTQPTPAQLTALAANGPYGAVYQSQLPPASRQSPGSVIETVDGGVFMATKEYGWLSMVPGDQRKLANWFKGGVAGKKVAWVGDSTTQVMANMSGPGVLFSSLQTGVNAGTPNPSTLAPGLAGSLHVNRGKNGGTLSVFLASTTLNSLVTAGGETTVPADLANNNGTGTNGQYDVSLARVIKENYDLVVLCYGINDTRGTAAWSSQFPDYRGVGYGVGNSAIAGQFIAAQLVQVINALTAANPNICIIARMPNPGITGGAGFLVPPGGGAAVTPTDALNVLAYAYRYLATYNLPNVVVWDSMASLYPQAAVASQTSNALIGNDASQGLHPTNPTGYLAIIQAVAQVMAPLSTAQAVLSAQQAAAIHQEQSVGWNWSGPVQDTTFYLDPSDWYPVYQVSCPAAGSNFFRVQSNETDLVANTAGLQMGGVSAFGHSPGQDAPLGACVGDVILWPGVPFTTRIVNVEGLTGNPFMQWNPQAAGTNICGADDNGFLSANPNSFAGQNGTIYRHKYAYSSVAKALLTAQGLSQYQRNLFPNGYRCQVAYFFGGFVSGTAWVVVQPVPGELAANGKNLAAHTITANDLLCLAGAEGGNFPSPGGINVVGLVLTSATITNASTNQASTACTATSASPCVFTATGHQYSNGQAVYLGGTAVPTGFVAGQPLFVVASTANTFELAATPNGAAINSSSTGTAVTVQAVPQAATIQVADVAAHDFTKFVTPQGFIFSAT